MASEPAEAPEGFKQAPKPEQQGGEEYDTEWIDRPDVGQMVRGMLLAAKPNRGKFDTTVLELRLTEPYGSEHDEGDLVAMWSTSGIDDQLEAVGGRGEEIVIVCDETFEYEDDDGEEQVGRSYSVYVQE